MHVHTIITTPNMNCTCTVIIIQSYSRAVEYTKRNGKKYNILELSAVANVP